MNLKSKLSSFLESLKTIYQNDSRILKWYFKNKPSYIVFYTILTIALALIPFLVNWNASLVINKIIDYTQHYKVFKFEYFKPILYLLLFIQSITIIQTLLNKLFDYLKELNSNYCNLTFEYLMQKKESSLDFEYLEGSEFNLKVRRASNGIYRIPYFINDRFNLFKNIITLVVSFGFIVSFNILLTPLIILSLIPNFIVDNKTNKKRRDLYENEDEDKKISNEVGFQLFSAYRIKETRILGLRFHFLNLASKLRQKFINQDMKIYLYNQKYSFIGDFI